jgi:hypothetical protein
MISPALRSSAALSGLCALAIATLLSACYDHRVTQAIIERRRRAKEAEGAKIHAARTASPKTGTRQGRVRFFVSKSFSEQHRDATHMLASLIDEANNVATSHFNLRFEIASTSAWTPKCDPNRLEQCTNELAKLDPGEDGDWIVGVLGAMPSFTATFEQLGMARLPGRHFVIRDVSDLAEREAIDRAFATFTPARRDEIYKRRKSHKRLAIFLHEWAHTLGGLHVQNNKSLLNPSYDDSMEAFDDGNHGLIDASLRDLFRYAGTHDELKAYLHGNAVGEFAAEERVALLARLEEPAPRAQGSAGGEGAALPEHQLLVRGSEEGLLAGFDQADRAAYREAAHLTAAGDSVAALAIAKPLGERHPDSYAVQYLLCGLAMQLGDHALAQSACPRASSPSGAGTQHPTR